MEFIGALDVGDVKFPGDVKDKEDVLKEAYELGKKF